MPAKTPEPPYYALNFTTIVSPATIDLFTKFNAFVRETAPQAPGYLGIEDAKGEKEWITITYWQDRESLESWTKGLKSFAVRHPTAMMALISARARTAKVEKVFP